MHKLEKLKEVYKKVIEQATPLVELSLGEGKQFDKEKFMFLIEATKGLKEIEELEIMKEGKDFVYDYFDLDGEGEEYRDGKRERVRGYTRNGKRERVSGYYRNGRMMRDDIGRYDSRRSGKIVVKDTYDYMPESGSYGLNGLEYEEMDEYNRTLGMREDERNGRTAVDYRGYNAGMNSRGNNSSGYDSGSRNRNYRFKHKYKDEYDTEIEEEIYKIIENKPEEQQTEVVEKIINILAEPINDMKITYPRIYDKVINKIKVMK